MPSLLEKEIYFTVFAFSLFKRPLTSSEIWQFLLKLPGQNQEKIRISEIFQTLEKSNFLKEKIIFKNGFWTTKEKQNLLLKRQETNLLIDLKLKKLKRYLKLLRYIPFLEGTFVFGSMAIGNAKKESDFDLALIAKNGRIWSLRAFAIFIFEIFFIRKRGSEHNPKKTKNKICLSYFLSKKKMGYFQPDYYQAINHIVLVPVFGKKELFFEFARQNQWLKDYFVNFQDDFFAIKTDNNFYIKNKNFLAKFLEKIFSKKFGNYLEKILKFFQKKRINYSLKKITNPDKIIISDTKLELHPENKNKNEILKQINSFLINI